MDEHNRRRRQNEAPYSGHPDQRFAADQNQIRGFSGSSAERFRPPPLTTSPSTGRGATGATAYQGYYQETAPSFSAALPANTMQYQQGYSQDQRQQQQSFGGYNSDLMYNVAQQPAQNNVYDATTQFQARQPAAMQMLTDVATAPYFSSETANAPAPPGLQHHASTGSTGVYPQHHSPNVRAPLLQQTYATGMPMGNLPQVAPEMLEVEDEYQAQDQAPINNLARVEESYMSYQTALKEIFQNVANGMLSEAAASLLRVSEWLLGNVVDLGLIIDDVALHGQRIGLWNDFNNAWLSIFQKQKDMLQAGQRIQHPQSLMTQDYINKMAKDLLRMCDAIEKHGLVDYQYGVAEEQIIMIIKDCLDLQESLEGSHNPGVGRAPP